jgi:hypothetical protein
MVRELDYEKLDQSVTLWRNDLDVPQSFLLLQKGKDATSGRLAKVTIKPGKEIELPSEFDSSIHEVRDGMIVGGLAPRLTKVGSKAILHKCLDCDKVEEEKRLFELTKKVMEKESLEKAISIRATEVQSKTKKV